MRSSTEPPSPTHDPGPRHQPDNTTTGQPPPARAPSGAGPEAGYRPEPQERTRTMFQVRFHGRGGQAARRERSRRGLPPDPRPDARARHRGRRGPGRRRHHALAIHVTDRNHDDALTDAALARLASDPSGTIVTSRAYANTRGIRGCCYRGEGWDGHDSTSTRHRHHGRRDPARPPRPTPGRSGCPSATSTGCCCAASTTALPTICSPTALRVHRAGFRRSRRDGGGPGTPPRDGSARARRGAG